MRLRVFISVLAVTLTSMTPFALAGEPVGKAVIEQLRKTLEVPSSGLKIKTVRTSEIKGLYEVQFIDGPLVYSSQSGDHFILGDMFNVGPTGYTNLAEKRRDTERADRLASVSPDEMIVFAAADKPRTHITVFTDVTCFYCQKLHKEVPELNRRGVEVRYLAYPRAGLESDGYRQLASAWCADNPQDVLTRLKNQQPVPEKVCPGNPVADQFELGQQLGVRGTPAIVTATGKMIPGYQSARDLMETLGLK